MNKQTNSNIKLSPIYGLFLLRKHIDKGITDISVENIIQRYKEIDLESKKYVSKKKAKKKLQMIIELSDMIIKSNKSQLNLLNKNKKNQFNLSKSEILNKSNSILMNEQQYIRLLSPFNSKLTSYTNHIYTFTNRPINK